jgi:hypothetical protein
MVFEQDGSWWVDGVLRRADPHHEDRLPQLERMIVRELLPAQRDVVHLHAGCALLGRWGLLFCGSSGAGKSTFSRQAVQAGAHYLTDDCLLIYAGYASGIARTIQFDGLDPHEPVPAHLADCDLETYLSMNEKDEYRRVPLWRSSFPCRAGVPLAEITWVVVGLERGALDSVTPQTSLERLATLHAATVTVGQSYQDQLGFGPTYSLTWKDPSAAFALLVAQLEELT